MSKVPSEDLVVMAKELDRDFHAKIMGPPNWPTEEVFVGSRDWRHFIPGQLRRVWARVDYGERLVAFIVATEAKRWAEDEGC